MSRSAWLWRLSTLPGLAWLVALYIVPLGILAATAFAQVDLVGRPVYGDWSVENFRQVLSPLYLPVIVRSIVYALVATLICLVLGYIVAYTIARRGGRYRNLLALGVLVPWLIDYLVRIYAWMQLLGDEGIVMSLLHGVGLGTGEDFRLLGTPFAVLVGLVYNGLPFMILPIYVVLERQDPRFVEAGRDLYATARQTFFHVTLPLTGAAVVSGSTVVFLFSFSDFATPRLLGGTDQYMVGNLIQDQFTGVGALPFGAAVTVCMLILVLIMLLVFGRLARRFGDEVLG